ncbi:MAG: Na+/H+ antiporter NhaC family protein [Tidjanibacter sp.]|nr:Na+/H+ antiporter NhaC family protein [Tidjanibacter sp.]
MKDSKRGLVALTPLMVMLAVFLVGSIVAGDFYRIPISLAFLVATIYALTLWRKNGLNKNVENFSRGAGSSRILYMIWIFVLAGAFATSAKAMGAVDATVQLALKAIPGNFMPAGIFLATCFISMSIGTSVGTIVALTPVVTGLAKQLGVDTAWMVAIVVGGAFFGDNLSFISDTTIAATQTQGCAMKDKFRTNLRLVTPAAIVALLIYLLTGAGVGEVEAIDYTWAEAVKVLPYALVIGLALGGVNVLVVLACGILATGVVGVSTGAIEFFALTASLGEGMCSMGELIIVTMLAGGLLELVKVGGGLDYIISGITKNINNRRGGEGAIALLTMLSNVCTANNTIAILTIGDISRNIAGRFGISPKRAASLIDTTSCFVQGVLPYGAQLLMASGLAGVSPVAIIPHLYYPALIGVMVAVSIFFGKKEVLSDKI